MNLLSKNKTFSIIIMQRKLSRERKLIIVDCVNVVLSLSAHLKVMLLMEDMCSMQHPVVKILILVMMIPSCLLYIKHSSNLNLLLLQS